jgi:uncharacterized protein YndB with AHSA1/START domain
LDPILLDIYVETELNLVWSAWTKSDQVSNWFAPETNIVAENGGAYELFFDPSDYTRMSTLGCVITKMEPMKELSFTWKGPDQFSQLMNEPIPVTYVEISFEKEKKGSRIFVKHSGWQDGEPWEEARIWHITAWKQVLENMKSFLES